MDNNIEVWKEIPGYKGLYQASNQGIIKSVSKKIPVDNMPFKTRLLSEKLIKPYSNRKYFKVTLYKDKIAKTLLVHRLIALTFISNEDEKPYINHINGIKTDNRVENLEWCTALENIHHAINTGLNINFGENHGRCKLSDLQVKEIKNKYIKRVVTLNQLANEYNISKSTIENIVKNKSRIITSRIP